MNKTIRELNLTDIYRTFYPQTAEYVLFQWTWITAHDYTGSGAGLPNPRHSTAGLKLGGGANAPKHDAPGDPTPCCNTILNSQWIKEEITREIGKYSEVNKNENATQK